MIITCEKCQTRFKVGDDKLAQGPIRVRCSKCNHVFMASAPGALATSLSPLTSTPTTLPPATPTAPAFPPSPNMATAVHQPFQSSPPSPGLAGAPRAGIFRPPPTSLPVTTVTPMAPTTSRASSQPPTPGASGQLPDPFGTQANTVGATPRALDPFGLGPSAASAPSSLSPSYPPSPSFPSSPYPSPYPSPFPPSPSPYPPSPSFPPTPGFAPPPSFAEARLPRPATIDPFAGLGVSSAGARALDNSGGSPSRPMASRPTPAPALPRPPTQDPFAGMGTPTNLARPPSKDPFAGIGAAPPSAAIDSARGPQFPAEASAAQFPAEASAGQFPAEAHVPFPTASADPFAQSFAPADAISADALFGTSKSAAADPFANLGAPPSQGMIPQGDPFAPRDSGSIKVDDADVQEIGPQSSAPYSADDGGDPFGSLDDAPVDASNLFAPPPSSSPSSPSSPPARAVERAPDVNRIASPPHSDPGRAMTTLRRRETVQRAKEIAWAAAQGVLFASFLVVAVVIARGGDLADLGRGDLRGAFVGGGSTSELAVEDVRVNKRALPSGGSVVVVTGAVRNRSDSVVAGVRVEVRFGDDDRATPAFGWAWSSLDGVDVEGLASADAAHALSQRSPRSASLAPGDRAPFVVVGPAPAEGAKAKVVVSVATPPPESGRIP